MGKRQRPTRRVLQLLGAKSSRPTALKIAAFWIDRFNEMRLIARYTRWRGTKPPRDAPRVDRLVWLRRLYLRWLPINVLLLIFAVVMKSSSSWVAFAFAMSMWSVWFVFISASLKDAQRISLVLGANVTGRGTLPIRATKADFDALWLPRIGEPAATIAFHLRKVTLVSGPALLALACGASFLLSDHAPLEVALGIVAIGGAVALFGYLIRAQRKFASALSEHYGTIVKASELPGLRTDRFDVWCKKRGLPTPALTH